MEDVPLGSPSPRSDDGDGFLKNPSEVSEYIRTHFPECKRKEDDRPANVVHQLDIKIVRMSGRHLSNFTIDKTKRMNILSNDEAGVSTEMNNTPKVIKNISYQSKVNDTVNQSNDNQLIDQSSINDYKMGRFAYSVLRNFFTELRLNFQTVRNFIQTNVKDYDENMSGEAREYLLYRTEMTHTHISDIIRKLKNIIKRESSGSSELKMLLIRIGGPDKNTARYRWMVSKCLQQATVLEQSLRLMLTFIYNEDKSVSKENIPPIVNIYE
ncbi:uncharacterized protein LOC116776457 isoform X2 [Danaus plexippus]|uniref:uncharacterized protein LOC116776457 isoform X2 n=1 Tax=Danaus plexippus TaxID=13037 RepID=UPI002AB273D9|nr:uncharacterized protein LOC116776457 isoform X2 [Danaus plexippus]